MPLSHSWIAFEYQIGKLRPDGSVDEVLFKDKFKIKV
jgi:hypothetical protein